jgi:L-iditol 2-dehydrogenase
MPDTMKAVIYPEPDKYEVDEVSLPEPPPGAALVKVMSTTICGTDFKILGGLFPGTKFPHVPGHEWSGEVVAAGGGVDEFSPGDRVGAEPHVGCGRCRTCLEGQYNLCENYGRVDKGHAHVGFTTSGGLAEYCTVSVKALHKLPETLSYDQGAFIESVGVALYAIERVGIEAGEDVLVVGPGAIGYCATQIARARGAGKVVLAGTRDERLSLAGELGCDASVNVCSEKDPAGAVRSLFRGRGADVVVELAGSADAGLLALLSARRGGRIVLAGSTSPGRELKVDLSVIVRGHLDIHGSVANPKWVCRRGLEMIARGYVNVGPLLTHRMELADFGEALETFRERKGGAYRVMMYPHGIPNG